MTIKTVFNPEGDILYVTTSGRDENAEEVFTYGQSIIEQAILNQSKRILVDERELVYEIGTIDLYGTAKAMAENAPKVSMAALVVKPDQVKDAEFWETVAVNRGLDVRLFTDIDKARKWLKLDE